MFEFGIRIGKVVKVNYAVNTVDVLLDAGYGVVFDVPVVFNLLSTGAGCYELPVLKTVAGSGQVDTAGNVTAVVDADKEKITDLFHLENTVPGKVDLDDINTNYAYAIVAAAGEQFGKSDPVCLGFLLPHRNQIVFDPDNVDPSLDPAVQTAIKKLKGAYLHRTNSGVYEIVDSDGNYEWFHPNGSFIRIAETPTQTDDGTIHVDLTGGNKRARNGDQATNIKWDVTKPVGVDGNPNSQRNLYAHVEIKTAKGVVEIDIDKETGNVTIKTPQDSSNADANNNQLTIICGGNATLESVQGDVNIQSANGKISVDANQEVTVNTDSGDNSSIQLGQNGDNGCDHLVLLTKLIEKFNQHQHLCTGSGHLTNGPTRTFDSSDGTTVTAAG